jgi:hypothetical protein
MGWHVLVVLLREYPGVADPNHRHALGHGVKSHWTELEDRVRRIAASSGMQNLLSHEDQEQVICAVLTSLVSPDSANDGRRQTSDDAYATYVRRKVRNGAKEMLRANPRSLRNRLHQPRMFPDLEAPKLPIDAARLARFRAHFDGLSDKDRFLLDLALIQGRTIAEIAEQTGLGFSQVTTRLFRLFGRLKP